MKSPIWKWGFPEHQVEEKTFQNFKSKIFEKWKINTKDQRNSILFPLIPEISDKQKDTIRDIFAHISIKRISFQNDKRIYYSLSRYWAKSKSIANDIKIAELILFPIQAKEIQDILTQAQKFDISIRTFNQWEENPIEQFPKNKTLGIVNVELMHKIIHFEPELFQATVQVGMKSNALQKFLQDQGWDLDINIKGYEHLNVLELIENHFHIQTSIENIQLHTPKGILIATQNNGYLQQYFNDNTLGIPSEVTIKIQPKAKYFRKIEAQLKDLNDIAKLIEQLKLNNIIFNNLYASNSINNSIINISESYKLQDELPKDFINSFIKKSEDILFKDEIERPIFLCIEFQEYHHSISSLLLKVKDIILQLEGKLITTHLKDKLDEWQTNYPYIENEAEENSIDCLHYTSIIPLNKIEDYHQAIQKKLEKNNFYPSNKTEYFILFSQSNCSLVQIDFYFFASAQHRKTENSLIEISRYFEKLLLSSKSIFDQAEKNLTINEELSNNIKKLTDPKGVLISKSSVLTSNYPKKN
jgi:hypothetical protein